MFSLAPQLVVGNLRLTAAGVYAEYLLSGVPFIFLSEEWQATVAADHAELWRALPSGASVSGLTVAVPAREIARPDVARPPGIARRRGRCEQRCLGGPLPHLATRPCRAPAAPAHLLAERPVGQ
jgi:hypothetical protein